MEKVFAKTDELTGTVKEYFQTKVEILKVDAIDKGSGIITRLAALLIVGSVVLCVMVFAGISLSIIIGTWLESTWAGFLAVAFLYLILAVIIWTTKNRLIRVPVINMMIQQLFGSHEKD